MQILVTGGTGFIGTVLVKLLITEGHQLTLLTRRPEEPSLQTLCNTDIIQSLDQLTPKHRFDAIINLAGEGIADKRWSTTRKQQLLDSRLKTTQALIDFIKQAEHKPGCLISGSAVGYYGDQGDKEVDEETEPNSDFGQELCRRWETLAQQAQQEGVRACLLRTGLVVGHNGGFLKRMLLPFKLGLGGPIGNGQQWMSWVHLEDLVQLILWLLNNKDCQGAYNGVAPDPVTNKVFTQILARCLHRPALIPAPAPILKLALGEMSTLLLTGQKVWPKRALKQGFVFRFTELEPALLDVL